MHVQQMLELDPSTQHWRLVTIDASRPVGSAPAPLQRAVRSTAFHVGVHMLVLTDAVVSASRTFDPLHSPEPDYAHEPWTDKWTRTDFFHATQV